MSRYSAQDDPASHFRLWQKMTSLAALVGSLLVSGCATVIPGSPRPAERSTTSQPDTQSIGDGACLITDLSVESHDWPAAMQNLTATPNAQGGIDVRGTVDSPSPGAEVHASVVTFDNDPGKSLGPQRSRGRQVRIASSFSDESLDSGPVVVRLRQVRETVIPELRGSTNRVYPVSERSIDIAFDRQGNRLEIDNALRDRLPRESDVVYEATSCELDEQTGKYVLGGKVLNPPDAYGSVISWAIQENGIAMVEKAPFANTGQLTVIHVPEVLCESVISAFALTGHTNAERLYKLTTPCPEGPSRGTGPAVTLA